MTTSSWPCRFVRHPSTSSHRAPLICLHPSFTDYFVACHYVHHPSASHPTPLICFLMTHFSFRYLEWDDYFMALAFLSAQRSKDPSKQVSLSECVTMLQVFFLAPVDLAKSCTMLFLVITSRLIPPFKKIGQASSLSLSTLHTQHNLTGKTCRGLLCSVFALLA